MVRGMDIVPPDAGYFGEYGDFCRETWDHVHDRYLLHNPASFPGILPGLLQGFADRAAGRGLPPGFVPSVTRWIVEGPRLLGVLDLRPRLSPFLARYGGSAGIAVRPSARGRGVATAVLPRALELLRELGASPIMLSCTEGNVASLRTLRASNWRRMERDWVAAFGAVRRFYYSG